MERRRWMVAGTDFSPAADRALDHAAELASRLGTCLALVHAVEDEPDVLPENDPTPLIRKRLDETARPLRARHPSLHVECVTRRGTPWDKLANVACDLGAEMIVVGARGEDSATESRFLGRVVTRLAVTSDRSVLVVPVRSKGAIDCPIYGSDHPMEPARSTKHRNEYQDRKFTEVVVMGQKLTVVVTGATGKQGGAVVKNLLGRGHEVRAVTRSIDSAKARELENAGVTLVRASLEDTAALTKALEGATSLFAMTTPFGGGPQAETRQGISAADAAKAAGVHLVFTSVGSANRQTGVPHFDSKYEVEKHIGRIGVRATVLAPVFFMENLYFGKEQLAKGIYGSHLPPTRQLAQVALADIGAVAVRLLEAPGRFAGKRFDLASDELTGNDVVAILSRVTGRPFTYFQIPLDVIRQRMGEDGAKMADWLDHVGYTVDRAALRREFPDVAFHDFESWAKAQDWNTLLGGA